MYVVTETKVKTNAPEGTLSASVRYVGEDFNEALNTAADILDFEILHNEWENYDEDGNGTEWWAVLKKEDWYKTIEVRHVNLRYWI